MRINVMAQMVVGLIGATIWGCEEAPNGARMQTAIRRSNDPASSVRLDEQPVDMQVYMRKQADLRNAEFMAGKAREAFAEAGSPILLQPVVKELFRRKRDLESEVAAIEQRLRGQSKSAEFDDPCKSIPIWAWIRVILEDRRHRRQRDVCGLVIELADLDDDGLCKFKVWYEGRKQTLTHLRQSFEMNAFGFEMRIESVNPTLKTVSLLVRRAPKVSLDVGH